MRRALVIAAMLAGACTAVDNFDTFKFVLDGGTDMTPPLSNFGGACSATAPCATGSNPATPMSCFTMLGNKMLPGGMCTHSCNAALGNIGCRDLSPDAQCVTVENMDVCLPHCDESLGRNCRTGYSCCAMRMTVTGPGACAPPVTDLCH